jgi:hypothetical protein
MNGWTDCLARQKATLRRMHARHTWAKDTQKWCITDDWRLGAAGSNCFSMRMREGEQMRASDNFHVASLNG